MFLVVFSNQIFSSEAKISSILGYVFATFNIHGIIRHILLNYYQGKNTVLILFHNL